MQDRKATAFSSLKLSDICSECFTLILHLRAIKEYGDPEMLRRRIKELLDKIERDGRHLDVPSDQTEMAKFALVAFIDESIITSEWSRKDVWRGNPLQLELYSRSDAGEEVFRRIEQLRQRVQDNAQVLEIFYLCLTLGFKGKYQLYEQEKLRQLIVDLHTELRRVIGKPLNLLSPNGRRKEEIADVVTHEIPPWVIGVAAAGVGFLFWVIMKFIISGQAGTFARQIESMI
ncbi:type IVB secretion system protein IcmH/DotU [candidate division KSB1 bacterium]|nr:type IVB secretion system protein IcmH/DotU [candidate division KSB1 bacterium]